MTWLFCISDWSLQIYRCWEDIHRYIDRQVRADIPEQNYGGNVQIYCMLPKAGPMHKAYKALKANPLEAICKSNWKGYQSVFMRFLFCHDFVSFFCFCTLEVSGNLATVFIVLSSRSSPCHVTWDLCFCFHRAIKHCGPVGRVRRVKGERHQLVSEF